MKWTETNFKTLCRDPVFGTVFTHFVKSQNFEMFVEQDDTMRKHQGAYLRLAEEVVAKIQTSS